MAMDSAPTSSGSGPLRTPEPEPLPIPSSSSSTFADADATPETGVVDSPVSPASPNALARFEFEMGRGNEGSKILMVEWDPTPTAEDGWIVSWDGKTTTFPVEEKVEEETGGYDVEVEVDNGKQRQRRQRIYFLLPSDTAVPPSVTISHAGAGRALTAKSMPAIFAPGLGIGSRDAGRRGVLHTAWARLRAGQLHDEIRAELRDNSESVGLEMAVQERLWIIDHFGLDDLRVSDAGATVPPMFSAPPQSPRSPLGGRLGEKLRGLKLATSPAELAHRSGNCYPQHQVPHLTNPSTAGKSADTTLLRPSAAGEGGSGVASLDAVLGAKQTAAAPPMTQSKETEDELFALPMSPRSPEMKTSPFSFLK
ncbi:hypothetical protein GGR54DRAFT_230382 [Hypoxylon sp. NC1633]|nr:hypothetical protein GGR54DRAFT_230382 [Hypoxylon sp. NC1633]